MITNGQDIGLVITAISIAFNVLVLMIQSKIRGDIATVRAEMYEKFTTKDDVREMLRRTDEARRVY